MRGGSGGVRQEGAGTTDNQRWCHYYQNKSSPFSEDLQISQRGVAANLCLPICNDVMQHIAINLSDGNIKDILTLVASIVGAEDARDVRSKDSGANGNKTKQQSNGWLVTANLLNKQQKSTLWLCGQGCSSALHHRR